MVTLPFQISAGKDTPFPVLVSPFFDFSFPPNDTCVSHATNPTAANDVIPTSSYDLPITDPPSPVLDLASPPPTRDSAITFSPLAPLLSPLHAKLVSSPAAPDFTPMVNHPMATCLKIGSLRPKAFPDFHLYHAT